MRTIVLKSGKVESIYDENDFKYILEDELGLDARRLFEDWVRTKQENENEDADRINELETENEELESTIDDLESQISYAKKHHSDIIQKICKQYELMIEISQAKNIDRKALSTALRDMNDIITVA